MATLDDVSAGFTEASEGFKKMNTTLTIFCGISALALLVATIAIFNNSK